MAAIDTIKKMLESGEITEFDLPVGCLHNEARAKKALENLQKEVDPALAAWQEYKALSAQIQSLNKVLAEDGEASMHDIGELLAYSPMRQDDRAAILDKRAALQKRQEEILPLAKEWGIFTRDPEFGGAYAN